MISNALFQHALLAGTVWTDNIFQSPKRQIDVHRHCWKFQPIQFSEQAFKLGNQHTQMFLHMHLDLNPRLVMRYRRWEQLDHSSDRIAQARLSARNSATRKAGFSLGLVLQKPPFKLSLPVRAPSVPNS